MLRVSFHVHMPRHRAMWGSVSKTARWNNNRKSVDMLIIRGFVFISRDTLRRGVARLREISQYVSFHRSKRRRIVVNIKRRINQEACSTTFSKKVL